MKKRPDGRYQLSIMIGYNADGKPKRKLVYSKTQREVKEKANELRLQHSMGIELDNDITVGEWAETWLRTYKSGVEYSTREMYAKVIKNYVVKTLGGMKLKDIKLAHLQKIINENSHKERTIKIFSITINQMLEQAVINDLIVKNPARGMKLPTSQKTISKRALTSEEMEKIKTLQLSAKDKCFVMLLLYTGMRKSEALAITKSDINSEDMLITINKTLVFKVNQSEIKHNPKTKAGVRIVPILAPLKDILGQYIESISTDLLFPASDGGTMSDTGYRRMWQRFCTAMGTKEITAHMFRHNYATILYNAGIDVKAAQTFLGHSSISVTMDIYTHLGEKNRDEATDKLNAFLTNID